MPPDLIPIRRLTQNREDILQDSYLQPVALPKTDSPHVRQLRKWGRCLHDPVWPPPLLPDESEQAPQERPAPQRGSFSEQQSGSGSADGLDTQPPCLRARFAR